MMKLKQINQSFHQSVHERATHATENENGSWRELLPKPPASPLHSRRRGPGKLKTFALLPLFLYQAEPFISWILLAVAVGILLIFILIAFILRPLSRRSKELAPKNKPQMDMETRPTPPMAPPEEAETLPDTVPTESKAAAPPVETAPPATETAPAVIEDDIDTIVSPALSAAADPVTEPMSGERPANISWQIAGLTDVGLKRELNEDNLVMLEDETSELGAYGIYVIADGLGGHEAGEVASKLTVDTIKRYHAENPPTAADAPFEDWLKATVMAANEAVLKHQKDSPERSKMGSTLVMALVADKSAHIVNVGDSRAYRIDNENIEQVSTDHSLVERLVQIGQITREEARTHKQRNVIYSIIGEKERLEIGFYHITLAPEERLLLCSDGLSSMVSDEALQKISHQYSDPSQASQMMVEAAKRAGGNDNITAILIQMNGN